jgi:hypothetical protein
VPVIDMVKIDVEGFGAGRRRGYERLIAADRVGGLCEFNRWLNENNTSVDQLADQFRDLDFEIETSTPWQTGPTSDGGQFHVRVRTRLHKRGARAPDSAS